MKPLTTKAYEEAVQRSVVNIPKFPFRKNLVHTFPFCNYLKDVYINLNTGKIDGICPIDELDCHGRIGKKHTIKLSKKKELYVPWDCEHCKIYKDQEKIWRAEKIQKDEERVRKEKGRIEKLAIHR